MHRPFVRSVVLVTFVTFTAVGCETRTASTPITPTPIPVDEPPFTATVTVNGAVTYPFGTSLGGLVTATLASIDPNPDNTVVVGLALGQWTTNACSLNLTNDSAVAGTSIVGTATTTGMLCARVYDVGKLTGPVTITLNITHF
jgi:hypothetical protein